MKKVDLDERIRLAPRNVTPKELIALLTGYGFVFRRATGDHFIYKKPGYRPFPVPINQKPLCIDVVKNALFLIDEIKEQQYKTNLVVRT